MARRSSTAPEVEPKPSLSIFGAPASDLPGESMAAGSNQSVQELLAKIASMEDFDIFADVGEPLARMQEKIMFTIFRDGDCVAGSVKLPYSWDMVHKKFGGGIFKVLCRCSSAQGYIKGQTLTLAPLEHVEEEEEEFESALTPVASPPAGDLSTLLQTMRESERQDSRLREEREEQRRRDDQDRRDREARERLEDQKKSSSDTMQLMAAMMKSSADQTNALLAGLMGGKKEEIKVEKLMELMDSRMEKMLDRVTNPKKSDMTVADQVKLLSDAEERGHRRAMQSVELAEKKAEQIADMRDSGGGNAEAHKPSTTEKLIEAAMPMVQAFAAQKLPAIMAAVSAPKPAPNPQPVARAGLSAPQLIAPAPRAVASVNHPGGPRVQPKNPTQLLREKIESVVIDEVGKDLLANFITQQFKPEAAAEASLRALASARISPEMVCSQFSLNDMLRVAKARELPDTLKPYFERFHAIFQAKANPAKPAQAAPAAEPKNAGPEDAASVAAEHTPKGPQPNGGGERAG